MKKPHLAAILVGSNGASETYVGAKVKACEQVGFDSTLVRFNEDISELDLLNEINKINNNQNIDGLIVQLPLPNHIDELKVTQAINVEKDVDGFHPTNIGRMALNLPTTTQCLPDVFILYLESNSIIPAGVAGKYVGKFRAILPILVGSPMSILMARNNIPGNCTVTLTHSRTKNLKEITRTADILIVALGKAQFINSEMIKDGACIIDVGINRVKSEKTKSGWKLLGDVDFDSVANMCSSITPVPGGVGPMTIAMLLKNTLKSAKNKYY